MVVFETLLANV